MFLFKSSNSVFFKIVVVLCILNGISCSDSETSNDIQEPELPKEWKLVEAASDEFDGTELNVAKWNKGLWYDFSGPTQQLAYKEDNITVEDGNLVLTAKKENHNGKAYTYGAVESKFDVPGADSYVEVRAKVLTSAANVLSAIWMQSSPLSASKNPNPEIDIMESFDYNQYEQALHTWHTVDGHTVRGHHKWNTGVDISEDFHVYKLERKGGKLKFYFDGNLAWETAPLISFVSMNRHMVLSLEGHLGQPVDAQLPKSFLIDYVRTYVYE